MIICLINFQVTEINWKRRPSLPTIVISFVEMGTSYELYVKCSQNIAYKAEGFRRHAFPDSLCEVELKGLVPLSGLIILSKKV